MIKLILGMVLTLVCMDLATIYTDTRLDKYVTGSYIDFEEFERKEPITYYFQNWLINPSIGLSTPLTARCTRDMRLTKTRREYFQCNKVQNLLSDLIYGDFE